jgi:hypothetical protein
MGLDTAKSTDRIVFVVLYVSVGMLTLWAGFRMADLGLEMRFVNDFLKRWEIGLAAYQADQGQWPVFNGNDHLAYMEELTRSMRRAGMSPPPSNLAAAYRYRLERFTGDSEEIFLLCLNDRIVLFGITEKTLEILDKAVDRRPDLSDGRLVGRPGKTKTTYIGQWRL